MSKPSTRLRIQIGLIATATATALSLSVNADEHEIRIGRYQTVSVDALLQEIELKPTLQPMEIPEDIATRGDALRWILQQHGYRLHADSERLLAATRFLAAALPAKERQRPAEPMRLALRSLLGDRMQVIVDPRTQQVFVSIDSQGDDDSRIRNVDE